MPLVYACISPTAVDGAPRIGAALRAVGEELASYRPEAVLVVSAPDAARRTIGVATAAQTVVGGRTHETDAGLAERIVKVANAAALPVEALLRPGAVDGPALPEGARVVRIEVARLTPRFHFEFGRALTQALDASTSLSAGGDQWRVAIACIGDLSGVLQSTAARRFDERYVRAIEEWDVKWLVGLDADVRRRAGESVVAQTAVLMGALSAYRIQPRVLAYEASEAGGQLVAAIDVAGPRRTAKEHPASQGAKGA